MQLNPCSLELSNRIDDVLETGLKVIINNNALSAGFAFIYFC